MSANAGASPEGDAVFRHKGDHIRESVANRAAYFCIWDAHMPLAMRPQRMHAERYEPCRFFFREPFSTHGCFCWIHRVSSLKEIECCQKTPLLRASETVELLLGRV